jgi:hypothetical protein
VSILAGTKKIRHGGTGTLPPRLDAKKLDGIKRVQKIVGSISFYVRVVVMTVLMALSSIAVEQTKAMEKTMARCTQLLDYLLGHADAKVWFHAFNMILNIHSDASYLSEAKACSRACGHFFMGWMPQDGKPIHLNGAFPVSTIILCFVVASTAEAKLGALYHNCQMGIIFFDSPSQIWITCNQKPPIHCNNTTAMGIANNTIKGQCSQSMEMRYFWIGDKVAQEMHALKWHPGQENLANYQGKHHMGSHHAVVRPWYLHVENSPRVLPQVERPSALKGCVRTLKDGYVRKVHASHTSHVTHNTCYLAQVPLHIFLRGVI